MAGRNRTWGGSPVVFPLADRRLGDAEPLSDVALDEPQIQPALPQAVAERSEFLRVGPSLGFSGS